MPSFAAQVDAWVRETKARQDAVLRESAQRVVELAQTPVAKGGNIPVDTGYLRASLHASLNGSVPPLQGKPEAGGPVRYDDTAVSLVISNAKVGDVITFAYGANYARYVHFGARGRAGRPWILLAAQNWPRIVDEVTAEAKRRAGA
jgi:hypothetical protein